MICDQCGGTMKVGDEFFFFSDSVGFAKDKNFCSYECLKEHAKENLDDLLEELIDCDTVDDPDPYARYGVSREDF